MAKKCGAAGENGALTSNYTPWAASVICHFLRWRCRSAQSREGLPLQQTCFKWDPRENSRQGNIAHACWFFFQAAITEEGKGSVSLLSPTQDSLPGLLLYFLLCNVGSSFSLFLPEAATPVQVLLFTFPGPSSWKAGDNTMLLFLFPYYSNMNISPSNHCSFKSPQTLPGFFTEG